MKEQRKLSENKPLNCISSDVITASKFIKKIELDKIELIEAFLEHEDLISWLRENMQGEV